MLATKEFPDQMEVIYHVSHKMHPLVLIGNIRTIMHGGVCDEDGVKNRYHVALLHTVASCAIPLCIKHVPEVEPIINQYYFHPQYPLILGPCYEKSICDVCGGKCVQGFRYRCSSCDFDACTKCGVAVAIFRDEIGVKIEHEGHPQHTLALLIKHAAFRCDACMSNDEDLSYCLNYSCKTCEFKLHLRCAVKAPYSRAHRYCKGREVPLKYPPIDHLADFYCDICETEIHPKFWMYYCHKCDNSFHVNCLEQFDCMEIASLKALLSVSYHKHPLTHVRRKKTPKYVCFGCNKDVKGHSVLECRTGTCPFRMCNRCHVNATVRSKSCT